MSLSLYDKAYKYYRKKWDNAALKVLEKMNGEEARVMELKAQIYYRLNQFEKSLQLFMTLLRTHSDEFDDIRRANVIAVKSRLQESGSSNPVDEEQLETFEQMYNTACHLLNRENYVQAGSLLDKAIAECKKALADEGSTEDEILIEIAPLMAQKGFVLQRTDRKKEALRIYLNLLKIKKLDQKVRHSILVNLDADYIKYGRKYRPRRLTGAPVNISKKKRKKTKLPASYEEGALPDPERWLPRQERAAYKKRLNKKLRDREIGRGTQGASSNQQTSNIDYSKAPEPEPSPKSTPPAQEGARLRPAGQQTKKPKKKKGAKW